MCVCGGTSASKEHPRLPEKRKENKAKMKETLASVASDFFFLHYPLSQQRCKVLFFFLLVPLY